MKVLRIDQIKPEIGLTLLAGTFTVEIELLDDQGKRHTIFLGGEHIDSLARMYNGAKEMMLLQVVEKHEAHELTLSGDL